MMGMTAMAPKTQPTSHQQCNCQLGYQGDAYCAAQSCTVGDNAADPSKINCLNSGTAVGEADDCTCDCSGTGYSGDTCNLCTTTNEVNTNCAALTDTSIGSGLTTTAPDTAIPEWFADEAAATAKWGHISDW
jgi:hypothetical protein